MRLAWQEQTGQGDQTDGLTVPDEEWPFVKDQVSATKGHSFCRLGSIPCFLKCVLSSGKLKSLYLVPRLVKRVGW